MLFDVVVMLPDGHTWQGEIDIDQTDLEVGDPVEVDLSDDEVKSYIYDTVADWLLTEQIDWRWAVKPDQIV